MSSEADHVDTNAEVAGTEADKLNTGALGTLVAVGVFAMITVTAAVTALVRHDLEEEQSQKDADANAVVIALKNSQRAVLNAPAGYIDRGKGVVSLPIDIAKQVVVNELSKDPNSATPPGSAVPVTTASAAPESSAATAGSAAPAASSAATPAEGKKPEEAGKNGSEKAGSSTKTEAPKSGGTMPSAKPAPAAPPVTPTAASPDAKAPGPLNH